MNKLLTKNLKEYGMTEKQIKGFYDSAHYADLEGLGCIATKEYFEEINSKLPVKEQIPTSVIQAVIMQTGDEEDEYYASTFFSGTSGHTLALAIGKLVTRYLERLNADEEQVMDYVGYIATSIAEAIDRDLHHPEEEEEEEEEDEDNINIDELRKLLKQLKQLEKIIK